MEQSVCFIGHRSIKETPELREQLRRYIATQIESGKTEFLFGDHSAFNDLCYAVVTELKKQYPTIRRIYFRAVYPDADAYTLGFFMRGYEESICPEGIDRAGRAAYIERNYAMIRESEVCVFYFDESYLPSRLNGKKSRLTDGKLQSGTALAYRYAIRQKKKVINLYSSVLF